MENTVLELSQRTANKVYSNGDYTAQLSKDIIINEGDQISIKNVFLDTTTSSGTQINIEHDLILELYNGYYITNWEKTNNKIYTNADGKTEDEVEGTDHIAMEIHKVTEPELFQATEFVKVDTITFRPYNTSYNWGDVTAVFSYKNTNEQESKFVVKIPELSNKRDSQYVAKVGTIILPGSLKITNLETLKKSSTTLNINKDVKYVSTSVNNTYFSPYLTKTQITLPKGSYEPLDLSEYISKELSKNNLLNDIEEESNTIIKSNFLKTTKVYKEGSTTEFENKDSDLPEDIIFVRNNGNKIFKYNGDNSYLVGTSQIQFNYNNSFSKFEIDFLNMPYYENSNISVGYTFYVKNNGTDRGKYFVISKNSGIFFTSLDAFRKDTGEHFDFWEGVMGFDLSKLCISIDHDLELRNFTAAGLTNCHVPTIYLKDGINTTSGYVGLDSTIVKDANFNKYITFGENPPQIFLKSTTGEQNSIVADYQTNALNIESSHFLLELTTVFENKYINTDLMTNKIQGIINRYYGYSSYTSGGGEVSIPYVHIGTPVILNSVNVRILNPDFRTPEDLGPDNVIYIMITKAYQPPMIEQQNEEKDKKDK